MKWWLGGCFLLAALLAVFLRLDADTQRARDARNDQQHRREIAKWKARYAEAWSSMKVQIDTVRVTTTKYRTLRDSLVITDTVQVERVLAAADTALVACDSLASSAERFKITADSTIHVQQAATDWYKAESQYQSRRANKWRIAAVALGGLVVWKAVW